MIDTTIKDGTVSSYRTEVTSSNALKVATIDYEQFAPTTLFFSNPTYGIDMNKNWSNSGAGNSNELIHNGTDTIAWTGSAIGGSWDFTSTGNPDSGTKNIEMILASVGDTAQFERSSPVTMVNHTGIQGRIYITQVGHINAELHIFAYDTGTATQVGTSVDIYDYVSTAATGVYQTFTIPLADMGLVGTTFDSIRIQVRVKAGATFDLDNIYLLDPTGSASIGTQSFELKPEVGEDLYVDDLIFNFADAYAGTVTDGTMPNIPYDGFFSLPELTNGILYSLIQNEQTIFVAPIKKFIDIMSYGVSKLNGYGSDGTNSWMTVALSFPVPRILKSATNDRMILQLSDDLSGLLFLRTTAICRRVI